MTEPNPLTLPPDARQRLSMRSSRVRFSVQGFAITLFCSYLCAAAYIFATFVFLPRSDAAYRQPLALIDPFVWTVAIPVATIIAVVVFPFALFSLWRRDVLRCGLFVLGTTILTILCVTPFLSGLAIPVSALVAVVALLFCRFTDLALFRQRAAPATTI